MTAAWHYGQFWNILFKNTFNSVQIIISNESHCWLENVRNSRKKCSNKPNIFLILLSISELTTSQKFFITVWPPGGANITFAENWNFELKFLLANSFMKKIISRVFWINFTNCKYCWDVCYLETKKNALKVLLQF